MDILTILHGLAASLHGVQAVYSEVLVNTTYKDKPQFQLTNDVSQHDSIIASYDLAQLVPLFSMLSMLNHVWSLSDSSGYRQVLYQGYNPVRWAEYSVSSSIMTWVIAQLSGITDIKTLTGLMIAGVALQGVGYSVERETAESLLYDDERLYQSAVRQQIIGFLIFATQFAVIWIAFFTSILASDSEVPSFVWAIIIIITLLYLSFGVLSVLYMKSAAKTGGIRDFRKIEMGYIVLSLVSKTFLMNMVLFGSVSRPNPTPTPT